MHRHRAWNFPISTLPFPRAGGESLVLVFSSLLAHCSGSQAPQLPFFFTTQPPSPVRGTMLDQAQYSFSLASCFNHSQPGASRQPSRRTTRQHCLSCSNCYADIVSQTLEAPFSWPPAESKTLEAWIQRQAVLLECFLVRIFFFLKTKIITLDRS